MDETLLRRLSDLLHDREVIDTAIEQITSVPGGDERTIQWVASEIFDIELDLSRPSTGLVGTFQSGRLSGHTVEVRSQRTCCDVLDTKGSITCEYCMVLAGPRRHDLPTSIRAPWNIDSVYLFEMQQVHRERGASLAPEPTVDALQWRAAEIYPSARNSILLVNPVQAAQLQLFLTAPRS